MTAAQNRPPVAKRVWHKMQEQQRQLARQQATRGLTVMWILATAYLVAMTVWYLPAVWPMPSAVLQAVYSSLSNGALLAGIAVAFTSIALGACRLLFMDDRIEFPSTR
jgi:ABC-type nitrate/sulfonate/bicarbonate transport system permease component